MNDEYLTGEVLATIHPSWRRALKNYRDPQTAEPLNLEDFVHEIVKKAQKTRIFPAPHQVFRALSDPVEHTKVLILGQDPYPTPGHAVGLSFSADPHVRPFPKSLINIFQEYSQDLGYPPPATADLSPWKEEGVMLLNRVLTVPSGQAGGHQGLGWEKITAAVVDILAHRPQPLVAILWGKPAQQLVPLIGSDNCITSAHPSPLSAYRGFWGSAPFSRANTLLEAQGVAPVNWRLPS